MKEIISRLDQKLIFIAKMASMPLARFAIFIVYVWFGLLKVLGTSPANPLVEELLEKTMPFLTFDQFIVAFGILEVLIGIIFLFPKLDRLGVFLIGFHLVTTVMPLFLLPQIAWQGFLTPTLEGQYMIKNILIVAVLCTLISQLKPLENKN